MPMIRFLNQCRTQFGTTEAIPSPPFIYSLNKKSRSFFVFSKIYRGETE
ncbi:hypothetical protein LEP1GSC058_3074 [Leptospira fainei serovar Hurstbridge str. BUT 6]|uniref:Uncharacterized protein n=1 Tax=Leptospira fainei serovar Hurstbridge str. BUT 6 TaxID=1193011 RepID=S3VZJ4_9LEPT|nr:hypothetical protein LEP1GSC058_3074 [Leptospira fainei serovar Hurstbridge str. BUT 6]